MSGADEYVNQSIGYTNHLRKPLELTMYTTHPHRLQFKHQRIILQPDEKGRIGIRAVPSTTHLETVVYILLVDPQLRLHDSFKLYITTLP